MMIGALNPFLRRIRTASWPSTSGSPTSIITRSTWPALAACTPLVPFSQETASNSSWSASCSTSASRNSESSSTIRILRLLAIAQASRFGRGGAASCEVDPSGNKEQAGTGDIPGHGECKDFAPCPPGSVKGDPGGATGGRAQPRVAYGRAGAYSGGAGPRGRAIRQAGRRQG